MSEAKIKKIDEEIKVLEAKKADIERKIKEKREEREGIEIRLNSDKLNTLLKACANNGIELNDIMRAINNKDLLSLQEQIENNNMREQVSNGNMQ